MLACAKQFNKRLSAEYVFLGLNKFYFFKSKSAIPWSKLKPCTLSTVDSHARAKGDWPLLIDGDNVDCKRNIYLLTDILSIVSSHK